MPGELRAAVKARCGVELPAELFGVEEGNAQLARVGSGDHFRIVAPLGRAFLTGTVDVGQLAADDFRRHNPRFRGEAEAANRRLVAALADAASARGCSSAQLALAWLLHKQPHTIPIPGTRRIAYLEANVQAAGIVLSAAEIAALDRLFEPAAVAGARYPDAGFLGVEGR